jgi:hypothetical protein
LSGRLRRVPIQGTGHLKAAIALNYQIRVNMENKKSEIISTLNGLKQTHLILDDCWYSCPKSGECCKDDYDENECDCGADNTNKKIDRIIELFKDTSKTDVKDLFMVERLAVKFCEQYGYSEGSIEYGIAGNAFAVGYGLAQKDIL